MNQAKFSGSSPSPEEESEENDIDFFFRRKILKLDVSEECEGKTKDEFKSLKQSSSKKNFAKKYLLKHGYKEGSGLGKYENGIIQPVEASKQKGRRGLGFEPIDLKDAVSKYDPNLEEISLDEEVLWLINDYPDTVNSECLESWLKFGPSKKCIDENSHFCEPSIINNILTSKNAFGTITVKELENGRRRSNPFESIHNAIFLNRAAMKMANLDAILDWMFTNPKNMDGDEVVEPNELLYFADVCAGPGGFSEYVLYRKKWRAKGFGFTLRDQNDFLLDQFWAGPSESFEPHYGEFGDGNVFKPENIDSFKKHVLKYTDGVGVHFMMADGGVHIDEKFNDQELICKKLYLCQCLIALHIVRAGGHFVVKLFDLFTEFSAGLIYLMYRSFRQISIIKPNTSRPANSERYLVCKWKREDCRDIADHLFEINKRVPEFDEKQEVSTEDVLELVPLSILLDDDKFYNYITSSNNRLGEKQVVSLLKLAAYSENVNLVEERQQELRKESLKKWEIPDEARAEPKKWDPRSKWTELLGNSSLIDLDCDAKKNTIHSYGFFKQNIVSKHSWYCVVLSGEEANGACAFYLGLGRNNVHKYGSGKWTKLNCSGLCLPANTLIYGELVQEYLGTGRGQRKIYAFHIIDGLFLGGEDIRRLSFIDRLNMCELFAKSLYKETCPVRVKTNYSLANIDILWEHLVLKSTKSSSFRASLCIPLGEESFFKAGGVMFIRDTKDPWNRFYSSRTNSMFFHNREKDNSLFERDVENEHLSRNIYADFEQCFRSRLIWWWDEGVVVHDSQTFPPDPNKLQKENILKWIKSLK